MILDSKKPKIGVLRSTYGRYSIRPELVSDEIETILSDGGVAIATPTSEKTFIASRNSSGGWSTVVC